VAIIVAILVAILVADPWRSFLAFSCAMEQELLDPGVAGVIGGNSQAVTAGSGALAISRQFCDGGFQ
jgi:hypothetical protein